MKIGIIGSGGPAKDLGMGFAERGDDVMLGSRDPAKLADWSAETGGSAGTFEDAAAFGELLVLACKGTATDEAIDLAGPANFAGKTVMDVTNPLVFGDGIPTLAYGPTDSAGERVQAKLPDANVVKTLNIVNSGQMVDPKVNNGPATMFVAGNDADAKEQVTGILSAFGWADVVDIGGIDASRELESLCVLWCRIAIPTQQWGVTFRLLRAP